MGRGTLFFTSLCKHLFLVLFNFLNQCIYCFDNFSIEIQEVQKRASEIIIDEVIGM